jgi:hypothetical protein
MLSNIKIKQLTELNTLFEVAAENMVCKNNYDFTLPLIFNNYYIEKIMVLDEECNLKTVYSITYDEVVSGN